MPRRSLKPCCAPGCGSLTAGRYCPTHQSQRSYHQSRGSAHARGYGSRWRKLRLLILARDPICRACGMAVSTDVDHVRPKAKGGTDHPANLQGLCHECHSRKTMIEDTGRGGDH